MDTMTRIKLALMVVAAVLFAASTRREDADFLRWIAIGLLVVALALRFVKKRPPPE